MAWTDEHKKELIAKYTEASPTPETTMQIVEDLATEFEQSINAVRMLLNKAGVYVKKTPAASGTKASAKNTGDAPKKASKADSIAELSQAIEAAGQTVDEEILSKLTGKAAIYFAQVIKALETN